MSSAITAALKARSYRAKQKRSEGGMNVSESSGSSGGISAAGLLGIVFITLKLCHVIDWSWWWVTAPFWVGAAIVLAFLLGGGLIMVVAAIIVAWLDHKR